MNNSIALVNTPDQLISATHIAACLEFIKGFEEYGFKSYNATTFEECCGHKILLLSNHHVDINFYLRLNSSCPDTIYILWYCFILVFSYGLSQGI